jgi:uncharacterized protein
MFFIQLKKGNAMWIRQLLILGLTLLLAACATDRAANEGGIGQGESATDMGVRYLLGKGVAKDDAKAFSYFSKGAEENDPFAQNEVAYMYAVGKGTPRDYAKAVKYYQLAADHGLASAQYNLGLLYWNGLGAPQDRNLAMVWFHKSAAHGFLPAKKMLQHA